MPTQSRPSPHRRPLWVSVVIVSAAAWTLAGAGVDLSGWANGSSGGRQRPTGSAQLVSVEPLPEMDGLACAWAGNNAGTALTTAWQQQEGAGRADSQQPGAKGRAEASQRKPLRVIQDPYAAFSPVAVDVKNEEVVLTDENNFRIMVYDRQTNTPPKANMSEPKRTIGGSQTKIEFQCGLYVDQTSGDIYAVNNDTVDTLVIFSRNAKGNVPADRELSTPHGTFGITVDEGRKELFLTVQHSNAVVVYDKMAKGKDAPLRTLQGNTTRLADPHGIALDTKRKLMFVTNHGSTREFRTGGPGEGAGQPTRRTIPGSGRMVPSSITVYPIDAKGDTPPIRVITGPKTQMDWPTGLALDEERGELYVANDMGDSVLVFRTDAEGDAAPVRVLKGPKSTLKNPTGVFLDFKNNELWVANFGNHSSTVYRMSAGGDTAPLRTIRSGPREEPALMIGNPGAVAYDSKRGNILVPN